MPICLWQWQKNRKRIGNEKIFAAQITTYGRTDNLAHLYLGVPKNIKMAAGLIGVSKMLGNLTENDSTPNKE